MFGLFKKKRLLPKENYFIYKSQTEKYRQLIVELDHLIARDTKIAIVVFFNDTLIEMKRLLKASETPFLENSLPSNDTGDQLLLLENNSPLIQQLNDTYHLVFAEIHPFRKNVEKVIASVPITTTVSCFTSMDSPFLDLFGSDRILSLMNRLDMKVNERIEHVLVIKAIIKGQHKIEAKVTHEKPAESMEEWVKINLPTNELAH